MLGMPGADHDAEPDWSGSAHRRLEIRRVAIRQPLAMFTGYNQDDLIRNQLTWVGETRLVLCVERPAAVLKITNLPAPTTTKTTGKK
jgi:hypothetical protein